MNAGTLQRSMTCCGRFQSSTPRARHGAACLSLKLALGRKTRTSNALSMTTVKRHFAALGRLFACDVPEAARRVPKARTLPTVLNFPTSAGNRDKRSMWQGEPLQKLFSSPVWIGCSSEARRSKPGKLIIKDDKYWLPLLGLYHGNRLEEFAQLHRADVQHEDGISFLDINDEGTSG